MIELGAECTYNLIWQTWPQFTYRPVHWHFYQFPLLMITPIFGGLR